MSNRVPDSERATIVDLLEGGKSVHATARQVGRGKATVSRIAAEAGLTLERSATKSATATRRELSRRGRLELLGALADAVWERLEAGELTPRELRDVAVSAGITVQRAREEMQEDRPQGGGTTVIVYAPSNGGGISPPPEVPVAIEVPGRVLPADDERTE